MIATEIVTECELDQPPQKVWRALTVPELMAAWLLPRDAEAAGGELAFDGNAAGLGTRVACDVVESEPHRLLRYRWRECDGEGNWEDAGGSDSIVTFHLEATAAGGTFLRIVHRGTTAAVVMQATSTVVMQASNSNHPVALCRAA